MDQIPPRSDHKILVRRNRCFFSYRKIPACELLLVHDELGNLCDKVTCLWKNTVRPEKLFWSLQISNLAGHYRSFMLSDHSIYWLAFSDKFVFFIPLQVKIKSWASSYNVANQRLTPQMYTHNELFSVIDWRLDTLMVQLQTICSYSSSTCSIA